MLTAPMKANYQTLLDAAKAGDLCLVDCIDATTGESVPTLCAVNRSQHEMNLVPLAALFTRDPYETLIPPTSGV